MHFFKRAIDFTLALMAFIFLLPLFIAVSLSIKLTSPGPVLFKQKRLTQNAKEFIIYKFRSMYVDFDKNAAGIQIKASSQAITPLGKILRKTKLDELPQLINIIKGDMAIVGPRPELPRRLKYYSASDKEIFALRSGISSPASVVFSNEEFLMEKVADPERFYIEKIMPYKIELNKYYIQNWSIFYDFKIILFTALQIIGVKCDNFVLQDKKLLAKKYEF